MTRADRAAELDRCPQPRTNERLARAMAFGFLPGAVVFGALLVPAVADQWDDYPPAWTVTALVVLLVPTVLAGALAFTAPLVVLRRLALVALVAGLLDSATLPLVARRGFATTPWTYDIAPIGVILGVLALPAGAAIAAAALESALLALDRTVSLHVAMPVLALQDGLYSLLFQTVFVALGAATLRAGAVADVAEAAARDAASSAAADTARERERARVNALVHDRVLATLLSAATGAPGAGSLARAEAARALRDLRALLAPPRPAGPVEAQMLMWTLQAVTTDLTPEAAFGYDLAPDAPAVPAEVADALAAATEEALRNSVRHADAVNRAVHVTVTAELVRVDVLDDGVGFDPGALPPTRLGISQSILGRMRALRGGEAFVVSTPGVGTRVQLSVRAER